MKRKTMVSFTLAGMVLAGCTQQKITEPVPAAVAPPAIVVSAEGAAVTAEPLPSRAAVSAASKPARAKTALRVVEAVFCTAVKDRNPQGVGDTFDSSVKKVFFFTRVQGAKTPTTMSHVWYWKEKKMADVPLAIRSEKWRTWSSKRIDRSWKGHWAVKVLDANGAVLITKDFQIQ